MNEHCPTCGKPLPVGSGGSCPSCLMSLGLAPFSPEANTPPPSNLEPEVPAGQSIGPYRLLKRIGEGGFGTVWMAQQVEPIRRQIALKILKPGMDSAQVVLRFEAERQALALMDHPNVARVIDGGTTEKGTPYFAMELVHGVPITTYCDERRLGVIERVRLFLPVCRAVQHAHQKGIIHRDLKPSNILVAELEGTAVPKVVDFGIAKATQERLTEKTLHTHLHQLLGTPAYMSPEQVHLGGLDIDSRSDIYSLGALLFELLTGTTPFDPRQTETGGLEALLRAIRETDIPKPSTRLGSLSPIELGTVAANRGLPPERLNRTLGHDLDWIVLKALEKDRNRRYESASALADDLTHFLNGEPVAAAPPSLRYRLGKFSRKHRTPLIFAAALVVVLLAGVITSTILAIRATRLAAAESRMRQTAERAREAQRELLYASEMSVAWRALDQGQVQRTLSVLEKHRPVPGQTDLRGWEWRYLQELTKPAALAVVPNQPSFVGALVYSPDNHRLAVGYGANGIVRTLDPATHQIIAEGSAGDGTIDALVYTPDGSGLFVARRTPDFVLLDGETLRIHHTFRGHQQRVSGLALSPDGSSLVSAAGDLYGQKGDAECFIWDTQQHQIRFRMPLSAEAALHPQFSKSGRYLSRGMNQSGCVEVWDLAETRLVTRFKAHPRLVWTAAFSPDESMLVTCGEDGFVRLWNWREREEIAQVGHHSGPASDVAFSPSGDQIASCGFDGTLRLWDVQRRAAQITLRGHVGRILRFAYSPDGREITSGGGPDRTLRVWDSRSRGLESDLDRSGQSMVRTAFTTDSSALVSLRSNEDGTTLKVWDTRSLAPRTECQLHLEKHSTQLLAGSLCGSQLGIAAAGSTEVAILDLSTGQPLRSLHSPIPLLGPVVCSQDARWLAVRAQDQQIVIWDLPAGRWITRLQLGGLPETTPTADEGALLFSKDGSDLWIATGRTPTVECLDWRQPKVRHHLEGHQKNVTCLALSPDGSLLASGSVDMSIRLWNAQTGGRVAELPGDSGGVTSVAFAPDGRTLAAGYYDGQVKLWSVTARAEIASLPSHVSIVYSVSFSPDGTTLASAGYDGVTRLGPVTVTAIPNPSSLFVFVDEHPDSLDTTAFWTSPARGDAAKFLSYPASYHDGGGALSFADGHVEWHGWRDASTRIPVTGRNDLAETDSPNNVDIQWLQERTLFSQEQ